MTWPKVLALCLSIFASGFIVGAALRGPAAPEVVGALGDRFPFRPRPPKPPAPEPIPDSFEKRDRDMLGLIERRQDAKFKQFTDDLADAVEKAADSGGNIVQGDEVGFFPGAGMLAGVIVKAVIFVIHMVFLSNIVWLFWSYPGWIIGGFAIAVSVVFYFNAGIFGAFAWVKSWFTKAKP